MDILNSYGRDEMIMILFQFFISVNGVDAQADLLYRYGISNGLSLIWQSQKGMRN